MMPVYIEAVSLLLQEVNETSLELKKELERTSGQKFRRVNHFVLLALAGVFRLPNLSQIDPMCSLYVGTANGCVRDTLNMLEQMYRDTLLPMPFTFMGISTNMAGFHIAQNLGLTGTNLTVSNLNDPFGQALALACMDIEMGKTNSALVGCIDEGVFPLNEFKRVTQKKSDAPLLEGGCWLKLSFACSNPLAVIIARESFKTQEAVDGYLKSQDVNEDLRVIIDQETNYVSSGNAIGYVRALQEQHSGVIALVTQSGRMHFTVTLTRMLGQFVYNENTTNPQKRS